MANSLSGGFRDVWSRRLQRLFFKTDVYRMIANFEEQENLKKGDAVHRPYKSAMTVNTLGSEGSYTRQDITVSDASLSIDTEKEVSFYVREPDVLMSSYDMADSFAQDAGKQLSNWIDGDVLGEVLNANSSNVIGNYEMGGGGSAADGIGFILSISNIQKMFGLANKKLDAQNLDRTGRWAVISPQVYEVLWEYIAGKESLLGDSTGTNGNIGRWGGFELYLSNSCCWTATLVYSTIATDTDTIIINGVTFTADADGAAVGAGHWSIEATNDLGAINLVYAINQTAGVTCSVDTYIALSAADRALMKGITATYTASTDLLTIVGEGVSYCAVSEVLTPAADVWTANLQIQHIMFGQGKPIDIVVLKYPNMDIKSRDGYVGSDFVTWTVYGLKTFAEGAKQIVNALVRSDAFTA